MKLCSLLLLVSLLGSLCMLGRAGEKWAVLVAGSNTYNNYRHQADVFHAYQLLIKNNFDPEHIITFAYDDIAHNVKNPFKGKVFNKPAKTAGVDVYEGVKIDYKGKDVDPTLFLHVLQGNKTAVHGHGTERVLESTSDDNVFLYFADHGAPGLIAFPSKYLYAKDLIPVFASMRSQYNKLVFYLEACESGSMFEKLPTDTQIYALSAANPKESSYGTYCSPNDAVNGKHIGSCLGDLFSVSFLESTEETQDLSKLSLTAQFKQIQKLTSKSHVMQWGDLSFGDDTIDQFIEGAQTVRDNDEGLLFSLNKEIRRFMNAYETPVYVDSRFMAVKTLSQVYARERTPEALAELKEEMHSMQRMDNIFTRLIEKYELDGNYNPSEINFECLQPVIEDLEARCGRTTDYGLTYFKYIAQACQQHSVRAISQELQCQEIQ